MNESDTRLELFAAIRSLSEVVPEMRGGQLVAVLGELCADIHGRGLWDASDAELLEATWRFRCNLEVATVNPSGRGASLRGRLAGIWVPRAGPAGDGSAAVPFR